MPRYALKVGYIPDLTYSGFSHQLHDELNLFTIVCKALRKARLVEDLESVVFASRTDRGVGALSQIIAFTCNRSPILPEINSHLPSIIQIFGKSKALINFNPRKEAILRTYSYFLLINDHYDVVQLKESFKEFNGTHNFQNFAKLDSKAPKNPVKTIVETSITPLNGNILYLQISSRSFLWQQIRRMIGHLIQVATTNLNVSDTKSLLSDQLTRKKPPSAPPVGLILNEIKYENLEFTYDEKGIKTFQQVLTDNIRSYQGHLAVNRFLNDSLSEVDLFS